MTDFQGGYTLLTGATGFLGSHLMNSLLLKGNKVIVTGRRSKEETFEERIYKLLKWFENTDYPGRLKIVETDYSRPFLGLSSQVYSLICSLTQEVIHCASDTSFAESKREKVLDFNVDQLNGILELASTAHIKTFTYISTAYAAGINGQLCMERLSKTREFVNVYEESKARAEQVIADFCKKYAIHLKIIRPTIVYGDSLTGRTLKFNAFYYPIRSLLTIKDIYLNDIKNHGGRRSAQQGIFLDNDGYLYLPLRFYVPRKGSINLIPVDYFVKATNRILELKENEGIYHLCNENPSNLDELAKFIKNFLKIKGVEVIYGKTENIKFRNPVEELFDRFIEPYRPYLSDDRIFDKTNADLVTKNLQAPLMTEGIFKNCMDYAIKVNWGESIFTKIN
jgi:nucleoside-diphosphate-sugar epimerase